MPRNRPGAKASRDVRTHPWALDLLTLWAKKGENSCAIELDLSTRSRWDLSGEWDGATALECLKLRGFESMRAAKNK